MATIRRERLPNYDVIKAVRNWPNYFLRSSPLNKVPTKCWYFLWVNLFYNIAFQAIIIDTPCHNLLHFVIISMTPVILVYVTVIILNLNRYLYPYIKPVLSIRPKRNSPFQALDPLAHPR